MSYRTIRGGAARIIAAVACLNIAACDAPANTLRPESDFAQWISSLYWEAIGFYSLVLALVITLIVLVLVKYSTRRVEGVFEPPVHVEEHLMLEFAWTAGPAAILLLVAIPAIVINFMSQPNNPPANALHIEVIAHQWWWEFRYPGYKVTTANEVHVPVDKTVYFSLNSADIIHSFWVPRLGGKRDVIPNHTNELIFVPDKIGEYYGECAEFCGLSHANMRMRVFVDSDNQFQRWIRDQQSGPREPQPGQPDYGQLEAGLQLFEGAPCTACHRIDGVSKGAIAPVLTHFGSRTTLAGGMLLNRPAQLEAWIADPDRLKPGAKMPSLALNRVQLQAMAAYLESLK